jgi:citrate synthase
MTPSVESVISDALRIPIESVDDRIGYQKLPEWDSANHVGLIGALEDAFGFFVDDRDIPLLTTVAAIRAYVEQHRVG